MTNTKIANLKGLNVDNLAGQFRAFVMQKPNFCSFNYSDAKSYQSDYRFYKKYADKNRNIPMYELVNIFRELTDEELAHRVFNQRLYINENGTLEYITGQYYPTEYQAAAHEVYQQAKRIYELKQKGEW